MYTVEIDRPLEVLGSKVSRRAAVAGVGVNLLLPDLNLEREKRCQHQKLQLKNEWASHSGLDQHFGI